MLSFDANFCVMVLKDESTPYEYSVMTLDGWIVLLIFLVKDFLFFAWLLLWECLRL